MELVLGLRHGVDRVKGGSLVEVVERRVAGGSDPWGAGGQSEMHEDRLDRRGVGEKGDEAHFGPAARALEREALIDARDQSCPQSSGRCK